MKQQSPARSTNYIFVVGENRDNTYAVQNAQTPDITLGETSFGSQPKDVFIPSNKIETSPIVLQILLSEDLSQWIDMYKWMLSIKNADRLQLPNLVRSCELMTLDAQNQPLHRFVYSDCFPTNISSINYTTQGESIALSIDVTLRYNTFKVITQSGEIIEDTYTGRENAE